MTPLFSVQAVVALAALNTITTAAELAGNAQFPSADWMSSAEHITLSGALIFAVCVLWKQIGKKDADISKKDDLLIASTKTVTEALAAAAASNIELRHIITASVEAKRELALSIEGLRGSLQKLPCSDPDTWDIRHHVKD